MPIPKDNTQCQHPRTIRNANTQGQYAMPIPKDNMQGQYPRTIRNANTQGQYPRTIPKDNEFSLFKDLLLKGCDSNFEVICSNVKSGYEADNYLAINNMY